jgi:hypothetical protein
MKVYWVFTTVATGIDGTDDDVMDEATMMATTNEKKSLYREPKW